MSDSPSERIDRALKAIEELVQKDEFLVSKGFWSDALENQSRLAALVSDLPALLAETGLEKAIPPEVRRRVTALIKIQEESVNSAAKHRSEVGAELHRGAEARARLSNVRPAYTNPFKAALRDQQFYRLDSKG